MSQSEIKPELKYVALLNQMDEWVRQGQSARVLHQLQKIPQAHLPRVYRFPLAESFLKNLHMKVERTSFTAEKAAKITGFSKRFIQMQLQKGLQQKKLARFGRGRSTEYRFSNHWKRQAS